MLTVHYKLLFQIFTLCSVTAKSFHGTSHNGPCNDSHPDWTCKYHTECPPDKEYNACGKGAEGIMVCCGNQETKIAKRAVSTTIPKSEKMCEKYAESIITWIDSPVLQEEEVKIRVDNCPFIGKPLVTGGEQAGPKEFPHMALIGFGNESSVSWLCGGSLISERYILSAAHCSYSKERGLARWATLGDLDLASEDDDAEPVTLEIVERINHPDYKPPKFYNDIALFKLESDVKFNNYVRPICLHRGPDVSGKLVATGWGRTRWQGWPSDNLMKVTLDVMEFKKCNKTYQQLIGPNLNKGLDDKNMLCAGGVGNKDTCQGDSGGPLQFLRTKPYCMLSQVGVTSFGAECGLGRPAIYTKVSFYIDWIESIVWP